MKSFDFYFKNNTSLLIAIIKNRKKLIGGVERDINRTYLSYLQIKSNKQKKTKKQKNKKTKKQKNKKKQKQKTKNKKKQKQKNKKT